LISLRLIFFSQEALDSATKGGAILEEFGELKVYYATALANQATIHGYLNNLPEAREANEKALDVFLRIVGRDNEYTR
jgi:hypothetical protein